MSCKNCARIDRAPTRRELLWEVGGGLAGIALASLMADEAHAAPQPSRPQYRGPAKHVIFISLPGGLSHVDTFDYKPELVKHHGQEVQG